MSNKNPERYPIQRSGLYRLPNQRALAKLLGFTPRVLKKAAANPRLYYHFKDEMIAGKDRKIRTPYGLMRRIHERLQALFNRIERPNFLHAPRHGSSYITNAEVHAKSSEVGKLDIRQFYPSTTSEHVFQFLKHQMEMSDDVAGLLTKLCTIEDRAPFGSPLSPILCFHVHRRMFVAIDEVCKSNRLKMTLYVDDITISGDKVPGYVIHTVKTLIRDEHLKYHKIRKRKVRLGVVITGVKLMRNRTEPANISHRKLRDKIEKLDSMTDLQEKKRLIDSIIGLNYHVIQTYSPGDPARRRAQRRHAGFHNLRLRVQRALNAELPKPNFDLQSDRSNDQTPPF